MANKRWKNVYVKDGATTDIVYWRGGWFAPITVAKLEAIPSSAVVVQGGLSFGSKSAMTHAGIGAGDLSIRHFKTKGQVWDQCEELWGVDIIPCPRGFVVDSFQGRTVSNMADGNEHIHFLDLDCVKFMHPQAQAQVTEILKGGDGLIGSASYTGPSKSYRRSWSASKYNPKNIKQKELELPTTAEVVKALTNDKNFVKTIAEATLNADVVPNEWADAKADPKVKGSKDNPTISLKTSSRRHDKQAIQNGLKIDAVAKAVSELKSDSAKLDALSKAVADLAARFPVPATGSGADAAPVPANQSA